MKEIPIIRTRERDTFKDAMVEWQVCLSSLQEFSVLIPLKQLVISSLKLRVHNKYFNTLLYSIPV